MPKIKGKNPVNSVDLNLWKGRDYLVLAKEKQIWLQELKGRENSFTD